MKAICTEGHERIAGLVEVSLDLPDQQDRDEGKQPTIFLNLDDLHWESVMMGAEGETTRPYAAFEVDFLQFLVDSIERDSRHGDEFMADVADVTAVWLEDFAAELRKKYPVKK